MKESKIHRRANFSGVKFEKLADFSECCFYKINFINIKLNDANFLHLSSLLNGHKDLLDKDNFENRESIRLIKAHFEKQNNIRESNKYFTIEQEKYLEDLDLNNSLEPNKNHTRFVLYLNKYISYFSTDWIRPLLVIFIFGFIASFFYNLIPLPEKTNIVLFSNNSNILWWSTGGFLFSILFYIIYLSKEWWLFIMLILVYIILLISIPETRSLTNDISKLINPLNIFKSKDYFEHIAPYGMFVKLIMVTLIYQFIVAFRQNTRRK